LGGCTHTLKKNTKALVSR